LVIGSRITACVPEETGDDRAQDGQKVKGRCMRGGLEEEREKTLEEDLIQKNDTHVSDGKGARHHGEETKGERARDRIESSISAT